MVYTIINKRKSKTALKTPSETAWFWGVGALVGVGDTREMSVCLIFLWRVFNFKL